MTKQTPLRRALLSGTCHSVRGRIVRNLAVSFIVGAAAAPASAQMLVGDGTIPCGAPYVIVGGDTLSQITARAYGDPMLYGILADANFDALGGNPENISVGMSLSIPCVDVSGNVIPPDQADEQKAETAASIKDVIEVEGTLEPEQLDTLFGPVALFPDQVLTPVLVATTFPLDVVKASRLVEESAELSDQERAALAVDQEWDASVRELAAGFPDLLTRMSDNIDWTEQAGEAVVAQTDDVLASIQRLRLAAQENGYLVDNEAQQVEEVNNQIVITPTDPNVVYVPTYDSQVVYTTPAVGPPAYYYGYNDSGWDDALVAGGIILGTAIILDNIFDNDDWNGWGNNGHIDWGRGDITIDRGDINIGGGDRVNIGGGDRVNIGDGDRVNIGDGDRPGIGGGDRPGIGSGDRPGIGGGDRISIGDSDRTQVDRDAIAGARDRVGKGGRTSISNTASRDVARQKIQTRKSNPAAKPANLKPSQRQTTGAAAARSRVQSSPKAASRGVQASRPAAHRAPKARAPSRSNAFQRPSGGGRAAASGHRGRSSMGSRGGGGGRGGGGLRRH